MIPYDSHDVYISLNLDKALGYDVVWALYACIPVVPHKAVAEVSEIGNLLERLVVVNHGWQSEATDGSKGD